MEGHVYNQVLGTSWARQDACPESEIIQMIFSKNQCLL